jgi:type I restriction enzyme S subunit
MAGEFIRESLPKDLPSLPAGWEYVPLANLVEDSRGICYGIVQPGSASDFGVPILRVNNVRHGRITIEDALRVSPDIEARYVRSRLRGGEIVLTLVGSLGESAIVPPELAGWNVARAVGVIPVANRTDTPWVEFCLRAPLLQHYIRIWATTTVQATFNLRDVAKLPIPMPPPTEKRAIACILGALDDKIELNRRMNRTLEAMARAIFQSWFVDFDPVRAKLALRGSEGAAGQAPAWLKPEIAALFPDRLVEVEGREMPEGWKLGSFLDVAELLSGGTPSTSNAEYWNGDIPWVSAKDVGGAKGSFLLETEKTITPLGLQRSSTRILPAYTTIITARGTVGSYCLLGIEMAMNQTNYGLRAKSGVGDYFIFFSIAEMIEHLRQHAYGTIFDTITTKTFQDTKTVRPSAPILDRFQEMTAPIMAKVLGNERQSRTLTALRDTLLPQLISGALRVADAERIVGRCL